MTKAAQLLEDKTEALSDTKLSSTITKMQKLTDANDHAAALVVFAELVADKKAVSAAKAFVVIRDYERAMPSEISSYVYTFRQRMLRLARRKFGDEVASKLYNAM